MPFEIIRNDISRVAADVIVNTANPEVAVGYGVDKAIYDAAGWEELLEARAKIGPMEPGQAAVTPAFGLAAQYIIHTVGPVWMGGGYGEREAVARCYRNSLSLAAELGAESIAFPLIATGTYGFPKDEALKIAVTEISSFLFTHDMKVLLVVYDREAFVISGKAFSDVKSFIEERDIRPPGSSMAVAERRRNIEANVAERRSQSYAMPAPEPQERRRLRDLLPRRKETAKETARSDEVFGAPDMVGAPLASPMPEEAIFDECMDAPIAPDDTMELDYGGSIEDVLGRKRETFQQMLFRIIDRKGLTDPEVYKKANIDRKLFSKIRSNVDYQPSKKTVLALAIALRLNLDETADLLRRAGMALSPSNEFDLIVGYYIDHGIWDIFEVNCTLFKLGQQTLGA